MVKITKKSGKTKKVYDYVLDCMETIKINRKIKADFTELCKKKNINKSKLIENIYKTILIRYRDGSFNNASGYVTIYIG